MISSLGLHSQNREGFFYLAGAFLKVGRRRDVEEAGMGQRHGPSPYSSAANL